MKIALEDAEKRLKESGNLFEVLFRSESGSTAEIYRPDKVDNQTPHERDEYYVIISGTGEFICGEESDTFKPGDLFFVEKGVEHRFVDFSDDFATWVIFV